MKNELLFLSIEKRKLGGVRSCYVYQLALKKESVRAINNTATHLHINLVAAASGLLVLFRIHCFLSCLSDAAACVASSLFHVDLELRVWVGRHTLAFVGSVLFREVHVDIRILSEAEIVAFTEGVGIAVFQLHELVCCFLDFGQSVHILVLLAQTSFSRGWSA